MIEKVKLRNFISHANTELELEDGVNIFIGQNGSGKTAVIDAITYALYGEHMRKKNENLVRNGTSEGGVSVTFSTAGRKFVVERRFNARGKLESAILREESPTKRLIVSGESKQFGETVTGEVEKILGLDYSKIKVASIVQQGELDDIINYNPRDFKDLLNKIIGIDKLDEAYNNIKDAIDRFRSKLREEYGYDDEGLDTVHKEIKKYTNEKSEAEKELERINRELNELYGKEKEDKERLEKLEPIREKVKELKTKKETLIKYARNKVDEYRKRVKDLEDIIKKAREYIEIVQKKGEIEGKIEELEGEETKLNQQLNSINKELGLWKGQSKIAEKLEFKNNICPVCGSKVEKIRDIFDREAIKKHIKELEDKLNEIYAKKEEVGKEKLELAKQEKEMIRVSEWLEDHGIRSQEQIEELENERKQIVDRLGKIPENIDFADITSLNLDELTNEIIEEIMKLEEETKGFDYQEYKCLKNELDSLEVKIRDKLIEQGKFEEKKKNAEEALKNLEQVYKELERARKHLSFYEKVRNDVFYRDGSLAQSLRSWALKEISERASEYIKLFEMGISRIELKEKKHDVNIECYGIRGQMDISSLSGGERVAVALALRFAMANLLGMGRIDFIILDEPTVHLDGERRRSLVELIDNLNRKHEFMNIKQIIIITHDEEIFSNSEVNALFKFRSMSEGTKVTKM